MSLVKSSVDLGIRSITIHGAPMTGKTVVSATVSDLCPKLPHAGPLVDLSDMLYVMGEDGGTLALTDVGLKVPTISVQDALNSVDKQELVHAKAWREAWGAIFAEIRAVKPQWVVYDTLTGINRLLGNFYAERLATVCSGNTQKMYNLIGVENALLYQQTTRLGCRSVYLFHSQADTSDLVDPSAKGGMEALQRNKRAERADGDLGKSEVILGAIGQARDLYVDNGSLVFHLQTSYDEKTQVYKRTLVSRQKDKILAKSRLVNTLPAEIEANLGTVLALHNKRVNNV